MSTPSIPPRVATGHQRPAAPGSTWVRRSYLGAAALFWLGVVAQTFLAGAGLFVSGGWLGWHSALGHLLSSPIPLLPLVLLVLSFVGRMPAADRWLCALLLVLAMVQPFVLYLRGVLPLLGALHPVNALLLFVLPMYLIARARHVLPGAAARPAVEPTRTTAAE